MKQHRRLMMAMVIIFLITIIGLLSGEIPRNGIMLVFLATGTYLLYEAMQSFKKDL